MRVFLAVELPERLRDRIAAAAARLLTDPGDRPPRVRLVAARHLHVTVRFLGEVQEASPVEWLAPLSEAVGRVPAGTASVRGWGAFPSPRRPRVVWCGITDARATLEVLERCVSTVLAPFGFPSESRAFHPHVTVARVRPARRGNDALTPAVTDALTNVGAPAAETALGEFPVSRLTVFRSHLSRTGARHEALHELPLREDP